MKESLLSHIASNFISEYENVANSSISYLLNNYTAARITLKKVINAGNVPTYYVTELSTKSNGRPDVTGLDEDGKKTVIIEGKFWANLTPNQPNNYLKELSAEGVLLFLAPERRVASLKQDIIRRLDGENSRIIVCSWLNFINQIEKENNKENNSHLASDLLQLKELCLKLDSEGMPPLSWSDLDPMNGRLSYQLADVIDECNGVLRKWNEASFKGLTSSGDKYGYGFYFRSYEIICRLYFSSYQWSTKDSQTPIWLNLYRDEIEDFDSIINKMKYFDSNNTYREVKHVAYGIQLKPGMDRELVVNHIVKTVKQVLATANE
jgi:hypothetical protein